VTADVDTVKGVGYRIIMANDIDRTEAERVIDELRASAKKLIERSRELAAEALRMKERADDLAQLIRQRDDRKRKRATGRGEPQSR
jgi:hypothetical protein